MTKLSHPGQEGLPKGEEPFLRVTSFLRSRQSARYSLYAQLVFGDSLAIFAGFSFAAMVRDERWLSPAGIDLIFLFIPLYILIAWNGQTFAHGNLTSFAESARRSALSFIIATLTIVSILFVTQAGEMISRVAFFIVVLSSITMLIAHRLLVSLWIKRTLQGRLTEELLIVDRVTFEGGKGCYRVDAVTAGLIPDLSDPEMLQRFSQATEFFDRVVVVCASEHQMAWSKLLKTVSATGEILVPEDDELGVIGISQFANYDTLVVARGPLSTSNRIKKRLFDIVVAGLALILLAPLLLIVAIAIKLDSPGPVFFRQNRVGQHNLPFRIFKFRSMNAEECDADGTVSTARDDNRISRVGRFIRKTSIDELPQFMNVLIGDMSIVGPRPHALGSLAGGQLFWEISDLYWMRHVLKPGITGLAQVRGFRGATDLQSDLENRLQADLEYLSGWRLWRDVSILFATLRVIVHPRAY